MNRIEKIAKKIVAEEPTVVYSAILIDENDGKRIVENAVHQNLYGEHVTLHYFGNAGGTETPYAGERVKVRLKNHYVDDRGEAWTVECDNEHVNEIKDVTQRLHITVSCADGTKPVYSNSLISNTEPDDLEGFEVDGVIAYYMSNRNWIR